MDNAMETRVIGGLPPKKGYLCAGPSHKDDRLHGFILWKPPYTNTSGLRLKG